MCTDAAAVGAALHAALTAPVRVCTPDMLLLCAVRCTMAAELAAPLARARASAHQRAPQPPPLLAGRQAVVALRARLRAVLGLRGMAREKLCSLAWPLLCARLSPPPAASVGRVCVCVCRACFSLQCVRVCVFGCVSLHGCLTD